MPPARIAEIEVRATLVGGTLAYGELPAPADRFTPARRAAGPANTVGTRHPQNLWLCVGEGADS